MALTSSLPSLIGCAFSVFSAGLCQIRRHSWLYCWVTKLFYSRTIKHLILWLPSASTLLMTFHLSWRPSNISFVFTKLAKCIINGKWHFQGFLVGLVYLRNWLGLTQKIIYSEERPNALLRIKLLQNIISCTQ